MKNLTGDYFIGLDIGTESVGWAVTDEEYNILDFNRKAMWGVHTFETGATAADRRLKRIARRRLERRKNRVRLLRDIFSEEISKVDPDFFSRLDESGLYPEDKSIKQSNSLFNDPQFDDKQFHRLFPTIYHLRAHLIRTDEKPDVRLLYLAIHHIIKNRGHFLFKGLSGDIPDFNDLMDRFIVHVREEHDIELTLLEGRNEEVKSVLTDDKMGLRAKNSELNTLLGAQDDDTKELVKLISGNKIRLDKLFDDEGLKDMRISFREIEDLDEVLLEFEAALGEERAQTLRYAKQIYDWSILSNILGDNDYLSDAKIQLYDQHKADLKTLKRFIRSAMPDKYREVFSDPDKEGNYCSYVYSCGKKLPKKKCDQEEFCKYLAGLTKDVDAEAITDKAFLDMLARIKDGSYMPKQKSKGNSVLPYSLHMKELRDILSNVGRFHPFLVQEDEDGLTATEKILLLLEFNIPYYVGPLDARSERAWIVRRSQESITPWNFTDIVDIDKTSENFIENLINDCTYLAKEPVLPKQSLLYSRFMLLNELNTLKVNGESIDPKVKNKLIDDLFVNIDRVRKVTLKRLKSYLQSEGLVEESDVITGVDDDIKSYLRSEIALRKVIGEKVGDTKFADEIVRMVTIFGGERGRIKAALENQYSDRLSASEIDAISGMSFNGWGRLSRKLLTEIFDVDQATGEEVNIITLLKQGNENLMQILERPAIKRQIDEHNAAHRGQHSALSYDLIEGLYASPAVKKGIWRALRVVEDVVKIMGRPPKKFFVETTREKGPRRRTVSRKKALEDLLRACGKDCAELLASLESTDEQRLRSRSLYLYYTQMGECIYCGRKFDLNELDTGSVNRDHIYPQSKIKDDSIHNNLVLVCQSCNQSKGDAYPIPMEIQSRRRDYWDYLKKLGLMTDQKHQRLIRRSSFDEEELAGFINRQLVETSQSVKATMDLLQTLYGNQSEMVHVKSRAVSDFRNEFDFLKCRLVNAHHHANDAYLSIVVGNVHDVKFTKNIRNFVRSDDPYNLSKMYERPVVRDSKVAWMPGDKGSIATVGKYMGRNNVLFTRHSEIRRGELFNDNPVRAEKGLFRKKDGLDPEKYGGFKGIKSAHLSLIEHGSSKKRIRRFEGVPVRLLSGGLTDEKYLEYLESELGYKDPKVIVPVIRMNSMLEIDGYRASVSGGNVNVLLLNNAAQLFVSREDHQYCRMIERFVEMRAEKRLPSTGDDVLQAYFKVSRERNAELYEFLQNKCQSRPYVVRFSTLEQRMSELKENFLEATMENQLLALHEIVSHFQSNAKTANLKVIKGGMLGRLTLSRNVDQKAATKIDMINQSPTGLFENRTRLVP